MCVYKPPTMHQGGLHDLKDTFQKRINERARAFREKRRDFKQEGQTWFASFNKQKWHRDGLNNKMPEEVV